MLCGFSMPSPVAFCDGWADGRNVKFPTGFSVSKEFEVVDEQNRDFGFFQWDWALTTCLWVLRVWLGCAPRGTADSARSGDESNLQWLSETLLSKKRLFFSVFLGKPMPKN